MLAVASELGGIRVAQHAPIATFAIWLAIALALAAHAERAVAVAVSAMLAVCGIWLPLSSPEAHDRIVRRAELAVAALAQDFAPDDPDLRALQRAAPAHARLGFWGRSGDELDFTRNAIRDVSFPVASRRNRDYLMQLAPASLALVDYVLVENVPPSELLDPLVADPWAANATAIDSVRARLAAVAANGHGALYRVVRR
jgi:hypothetical protein